MTMLFDLCLSVVVTLHLLAVGLAGWAPVACWWLEWRATRRDDELAGRLSRRLAGQSMTALALGMALGGVMLWLLWQRHGGAYFERYRIVPPSRLWFGVAELAFFFVCMALYRSTWQWFAGRRFWHRALAVAAASDLLYHFPPLFTAVTVVAARPELAAERPRFVSLLIEPEVLTRTFHHWLAGLAVTGVYVAWMALRSRDVTASDITASDAMVSGAMVSGARVSDAEGLPLESDPLERARTRLAAGGGRMALAATALQLPVGIWLLTVLPRGERSALLGGSPWTAICFACGLVAVMILLHHLAALALGGGGRREATRVAGLLALTMLLMVATRQRAKGEAIAANADWHGPGRRMATIRGPVRDPVRGPTPGTQPTKGNPTMTPQTVTIQDQQSGASARVLAGFGFNCFSFVTMHGGQPIDALWAAEDFEQGEGRASGNGIPLLFPFPGRIGGGKYEFAGQAYQLDVADGRNNAIHGFVLNRPWQIVEQAADRVVGRFQASVVDPAILKHWPGDFTLTVAYSVQGHCLRAEFTVENPGSPSGDASYKAGVLPFGLGAHPYFRLPLGPGGDADRCVVTVPIRQSWELVDMLPTGKLLTGAVHQKLSGGMPFADTHFDDVFTGVAHQGGRVRATIDDPVSGRALRIEFADTFRECVVYNPPHRDSICIEPYTCVPDPFRLTAAGVDAGLRVLGPGETFTTWMEVHVD